MEINGRVTSSLTGEFALFLIGMRINRPFLVHKWLPVACAMPRMLRELKRKPNTGLLHYEMWFSRTILVVQYWRSLNELLEYAHDRESMHLPAWRAFNRAIGTDGTVGIWHETYIVGPGRHESVYVNMPPFGLGRAGGIQPIHPATESASKRIEVNREEIG